MWTYENKSKKLLEDYDKLLRKLGGASIFPRFEGSEAQEIVAYAKWTSSATVGAKCLHAFRIHAWRSEDQGAFHDTMVRGRFLLSKNMELDSAATRELSAFRLVGHFSNDQELFLIQRATLLPLEENEELRPKMEDLLSEKVHVSDRLGRLTYDIHFNTFRGQVLREGRAVLLELADTAPDSVEAQEAKMDALLNGETGALKSCVATLRMDARFKANTTSEAPDVELSSVRLRSNLFLVSFHVRPSSVEFANVACLWRDGDFDRFRVDEIKLDGPT